MSGPTSYVLAALSRVALLLTLVAAPWALGGYPLSFQPTLFAGVWLSLLLWWLSVLTRSAEDREGGTILVDGLLPPVLLIACAAFQLIPFNTVPEIPPHAVLGDVARPLLAAADAETPLVPISVSPSHTRESAARYLFGLTAAFLGIQLFRDARQRLWLYRVIGLNCAALSLFGMWQAANWEAWEHKLFGSIPLGSGGQPFASFVNRNNAAGLLNMGVAVAAAWGFLAAMPGRVRSFRQLDSDSRSGRVSLDEPRPSPWWPGVILIVTMAGVAASLSRGGLLALGIGIGAALWILLESRKSQLVVAVLLVVIPVTALAVSSFGFDKQIRSRFAALSPLGDDKNGRIVHWSETWGAIEDAPMLGQGMGAYRYIHRPYQKMESAGWFVNADNQFFEVLVENGYIGLGLVLITLVLILFDVRRLLIYRAPWESRDAALLGGVLVATQVAQGLFDFGITLPANLLTACTLGGVVTGAAARALPFASVPTFSSPMSFRKTASIPMGLAMIVAVSLAWRELSVASTAYQAYRAAQEIDPEVNLRPGDYEATLGRVQDAAEARPDDSELQRSLGSLLVFGFRTGLAESLKTDPAAASLSEKEIWNRTRLERLFDEARRVPDEDTRKLYQDALKAADKENVLPAALEAYEVAMETSRWAPLVAERVAQLQQILNFDEVRARRSLALAAVGNPADGRKLVVLGVMARGMGADDLAVACWQRANEVNPAVFPEILAAGGLWLRRTGNLPKVVPPDLSFALRGVESRTGSEFAPQVAAHVEEVLKSRANEPGTPGLLGRVKLIQGDKKEALKQFEEAVRRQHFEWQWRVRVADLKAAEGRIVEAVKDLEDAAITFPREKEIQEKLAIYRRQVVQTPR